MPFLYVTKKAGLGCRQSKVILVFSLHRFTCQKVTIFLRSCGLCCLLCPHSALYASLCESLCLKYLGFLKPTEFMTTKPLSTSTFYPYSLLLYIPSLLFFSLSLVYHFYHLPLHTADWPSFTLTTFLFYFDPFLLALLHFHLFFFLGPLVFRHMWEGSVCVFLSV